jgi:hypothetical protein
VGKRAKKEEEEKEETGKRRRRKRRRDMSPVGEAFRRRCRMFPSLIRARRRGKDRRLRVR